MKLRSCSFSTIICAIACMCILSCSSDDSEIHQVSTYEINFIPAKTNSELKSLTNNTSNNMIRNLKQYDNMISQGKSPLIKLLPDVLEDFRGGLVFNNNGLASIKYGVIKKMLNEDEYNEVMAVFGLDTKDGFWDAASNNKNANAKIDYKGYKCLQAKTCYEDAQSICTSNC